MNAGRVVAAVGACLVLAGCSRDPMPYNITSLAVLPTDVTPFHQASGRAAGEYLTAALARKTSFRIIGVDSSTRLLAGPQGFGWYQSFRDQAKTAGYVTPSLSNLLAQRLNVNGILLPQLVVRLNGLIDGKAALSISIFEPSTGQRIWWNRQERNFRGTQGDPGFMRVVLDMAEELVDTMPRPAGEEVW